MNRKMNLEDLPNLVVNLSAKVDQLLEQINKLSNKEEDKTVWFDIDGLCNYLPQKPAKQTVYEWCSARKIPFHKAGGIRGKHNVFLKSEIDEWLSKSNIKSEENIVDEAIKFTKNENKRNHK